MKKLFTCILFGLLLSYGLGASVIGTNHTPRDRNQSNVNLSPYVDDLDQSMTDYDGALPLGRTNISGFYTNLSIAQSFIPQLEVLTRTYFLMGRNASTTYPCFLAVRENLTSDDLVVVSVEPSDFPLVNQTPSQEQMAWIEFNFDDLWVTPGQTYYLVVYTVNSTENYYWISGNGTNMYQNGTVYLSIDDGNTWSEFTDADGCFKTYGLHETFLEISIEGGFPGLVFGIKNIGNYTAWDITLNFSISGGLIFIGKHFSGTLSELPPGKQMSLQAGLIFGFGKVILSVQVSAANVRPISIEKNATILLFFILGIK